jgi:hypothetical protein
MKFEKKEIFGNCASIEVPPNFKDVSDFRQVPDNQEVFVSDDSDVTIIIELLESPINVLDEKSRLLLHWTDLENANSSKASNYEYCLATNNDNSNSEASMYMFGHQNIPKFNKDEDITKVKIYLFCMLLSNVLTDVLISLSIPINFDCYSDEDFVKIFKSFKVTDWSLFK